MLSISQNTHIKNIISEQGDPTPDPRFLELQYSFVMDLRIMGAQLEGPESFSHIFHTQGCFRDMDYSAIIPKKLHDQPYTIYCI